MCEVVSGSAVVARVSASAALTGIVGAIQAVAAPASAAAARDDQSRRQIRPRRADVGRAAASAALGEAGVGLAAPVRACFAEEAVAAHNREQRLAARDGQITGDASAEAAQSANLGLSGVPSLASNRDDVNRGHAVGYDERVDVRQVYASHRRAALSAAGLECPRRRRDQQRDNGRRGHEASDERRYLQ